jgi:hypothetical protein
LATEHSNWIEGIADRPVEEMKPLESLEDVIAAPRVLRQRLRPSAGAAAGGASRSSTSSSANATDAS